MAEGRVVAYAELDTAAGRVAAALEQRGVGEGDRVSTTLPPGIAFAELLHALPRLGAVLVPLNPSDPAPVDARLSVASPVARNAPSGGAPAGDAAAGRGPLRTAVDPAGSRGPLRATVDPEAVHTVIHTSGTDGRPKPVELTYANHYASALASAEVLGVEAGDRWLCPLPLFHVGGLAVLLRSAIYGTTAVVHERFDAERVLDELTSGEITLASLVPTMLARLRDAGLTEAPGVRAILLGGGPLPAGLLDWAAEIGLPVRPTYGMTETASQVATAAPGERAAWPLPGVELRIAVSGGEPSPATPGRAAADDPHATGEPSPATPRRVAVDDPHATGEILVRGPMVARGALAPDGWLHTGDRGRLDEEGRLVVEGRIKDIVVTGGENVSPVEVEEALLAHPDVLDAGVAGLPDPEWGEALTAYVVLRDASDPDLAGWCRARLAPHKVPKRFQRVHGLPRNAAGKLLRDQLGEPR